MQTSVKREQSFIILQRGGRGEGFIFEKLAPFI